MYNIIDDTNIKNCKKIIALFKYYFYQKVATKFEKAASIRKVDIYFKENNRTSFGFLSRKKEIKL